LLWPAACGHAGGAEHSFTSLRAEKAEHELLCYVSSVDAGLAAIEHRGRKEWMINTQERRFFEDDGTDQLFAVDGEAIAITNADEKHSASLQCCVRGHYQQRLAQRPGEERAFANSGQQAAKLLVNIRKRSAERVRRVRTEEAYHL
jgi:hypothetical protein